MKLRIPVSRGSASGCRSSNALSNASRSAARWPAACAMAAARSALTNPEERLRQRGQPDRNLHRVIGIGEDLEDLRRGEG